MTIKDEVIKLAKKKYVSYFAMDNALKTTSAQRKFRQARQDGEIAVKVRIKKGIRNKRPFTYNEYMVTGWNNKLSK